MVAVEARAAEPLIPVRFFTNRTRVTSNVLSLALMAAFLGYVFLLTLYCSRCSVTPHCGPGWCTCRSASGSAPGWA